MKIYYAHHLWKYNTKIEEYEISLIKKYLPNYNIINPNGSIIQGRPEDIIMIDCLKAIEDCDALVFSSMDGVVGHGVVDEVNHAIKLHKDVYYITNNKIIFIDKIKWNVINENNRIYATIEIN